MTTQQVADRYYELCQTGQFEKILGELYSPDCKSIEPANSGWKNAEGLEAIIQKGKDWNNEVEEMHGGFTNAPIVSGTHFSLVMGMDVTIKGKGRVKMDEVCVFEVKDGKIVLEQFFF